MVAQYCFSLQQKWITRGWKKGCKSLFLCLPLTGPKEQGGLSEWALMLRIQTPGHTGAHFCTLFFACAHCSVCNLPVFCGPMTMNLGNLSQVFSFDQMSLCRLSSHGFYKGTVESRDLWARCIMHTKDTAARTSNGVCYMSA